MFLRLIFLYLSFLPFATNAQNGTQKKYVFFLHNKFLEGHSLNESHPKYGPAAYKAILEKLQSTNSVILSEKRKLDTDPKMYAKKVILKIDSLHSFGVPYDQISIVGTSQGGYIGQYISYYAKNTDLKFVFIGSSFKNDSMNEDRNFRLYGKILSINEKTDVGAELLSRQLRFKNSDLKVFKEITLNTGLKHGFLFRALDEWIIPAKAWINSNNL
ncbi:alpha/beta hydrolase [Chryseobacterium camelliae]|uniref:alpha/beta hydrolase n=1 Tax=Chryseobacterium camelliae TaxID=1265445 RepID=UPI00286C3D6F|nr:alpha/beta hydrolase [Chryseobacterium camelliae]